MNDLLGARMKFQYEDRFRYKLLRRVPTIIRIDGKAFHTYTRGLNKPFDEGFIEDMQETMRFLCKEIQGVKLGYCQSDEISLLITDYDTINTSAWFDYNLQKMCSVSASLTTSEFNRLRIMRNMEFFNLDSDVAKMLVYGMTMANFDSRVFQIADLEEVVNYFIWRYFDAKRNSISMLTQSLYSPKELEGKNTTMQQQMCLDKGQDWNELHWSKRVGSVCLYQDQSWQIVERPDNDEFRNIVKELIKYE